MNYTECKFYQSGYCLKAHNCWGMNATCCENSQCPDLINQQQSPFALINLLDAFEKLFWESTTDTYHKTISAAKSKTASACIFRVWKYKNHMYSKMMYRYKKTLLPIEDADVEIEKMIERDFKNGKI